MENNKAMTLTHAAALYEIEVNGLPQIHHELGGGVARNRSGLVYENLIRRTCEALDLNPRKNDYKRTEVVDGSCLSNLQVDWHVYAESKMVKAIESKAYLDACYLKRAIMDFIELDNSPEVPDNVQYAIVAGQNACGKDAFAYYQAFFTKITGKTVKIFFLNPQRKRSSARAIYNEKCREDFTLSTEVYTNLTDFLRS
jgi:hypothetical protein